MATPSTFPRPNGTPFEPPFLPGTPRALPACSSPCACSWRLAIRKVRDHVASRWLALESLEDKSHLDAFKKRLEQLREVEGTDVPWPALRLGVLGVRRVDQGAPNVG